MRIDGIEVVEGAHITISNVLESQFTRLRTQVIMSESVKETTMKITVPNQKPRAREVNAVLVSKRCERHQDARRPNRAQQKQNFLKAMND